VQPSGPLTPPGRGDQALAVNPRLPEALAEVAGQWSAVNGVTGTVTTTGDPVGPHAEIEVTLLRVAQEALANVAKHTAAARAEAVTRAVALQPGPDLGNLRQRRHLDAVSSARLIS
jgi:hypothetical protein